jgi:hypothetical protein
MLEATFRSFIGDRGWAAFLDLHDTRQCVFTRCTCAGGPTEGSRWRGREARRHRFREIMTIPPR